jgi:uncharacterized protein (TIGR03084 family)
VTTPLLRSLLDDLAAEGDALERLVATGDDALWSRPTPAAGWTVAHQVAHLAWTDEVALVAAASPEDFQARIDEALRDPAGWVDREAESGAQAPPAELLQRWRSSRAALSEALAAVPAGQKLPWYGPPMSATSMATARLMETWAHGGDVAEALGVEPERTDRVRHVCHLAVRTRGFAYLLRDLPVPEEAPRVELLGPGGDLWTWGPEDSSQRVTGDAHDFALLATRRRHRDDVRVSAEGEQAEQWLEIVQAFAGPPGADPEKRS